ncbi:unnamed protein product [Zymoseptoria tritici ST99CH_1A5]|nr:unnamed protein product [Zymoseptoria tritici ST99CH_1E4]SMY25870.1 unnamed protein product [Zymoseptoria tritici ST99CH_1A5]
MGVAGPNFWTDEEIAIVKQTKASGTPLRETFGSLPRRSLNAKWKIPVDRERRDPRFRSGENFTAEDHHSVCRLREELRIKWEEIAGALQRNANSIKSFYYHRQKATTNVRETNAQNSWTNTDTNTLRDLVAQGRSEMQLAEQMKRSQPMIHRMKAELYHREPGLSQGSLWTAKEDQTARGSFQIRFAGLADSGLDITAKD